MKKRLSIFLVLFILCFSHLFANDPLPYYSQNPNARYRLFPTVNTWVYLKLDTMTGKIWCVQFSIDGEEHRHESPLSLLDITTTCELERKVGRYTLYPTRNSFNFIMLDQIDGVAFQVQWSLDGKNDFVIPIN
ncbi:hypothetical protein [Treponema sp. C6A8]|uniref:hypothetical protein n=1 Tax=Treponema sp. C6A8 TaxID=1410609 RepID=UPI0004806F0D|nr:hypothetical protein [Treponema sp. C6A8]